MAAREHVAVRISTAGREWCARVAKDASVPFSAVVRASLVVAAKHEAEVVKIVEEQR